MNLFSVDLEDWFHLLDSPSVPSLERWSALPSRVVKNTLRILDELDAHGVVGTFFVLGWVAEVYPELVAEVASRGHEIASHGYSHTLVYQMSPEEFRDDIRRASDAIHAACSIVPRGYRAPGFSLKRQSLWALDVLLDEGFAYDSSAFPAVRAHGGLPGSPPTPHLLRNGLAEIPISTASFGLVRCGYLGGGYLRLIPRPLLTALAKSQEKRGLPLVLYIHPRDYDQGQPRMDLGPVARFRAYVGLGGCMRKLRDLMAGHDWAPFIRQAEALTRPPCTQGVGTQAPVG